MKKELGPFFLRRLLLLRKSFELTITRHYFGTSQRANVQRIFGSVVFHCSIEMPESVERYHEDTPACAPVSGVLVVAVSAHNALNKTE